MDEYQWAYDHATSVGERGCPNCGSKSLHLIFVVDEPDAESGTAVFWCDSCMQGLAPNQAPVAEEGERIRRGTEVVPNYTVVVEE
jgi:hypothetical protein